MGGRCSVAVVALELELWYMTACDTNYDYSD